MPIKDLLTSRMLTATADKARKGATAAFTPQGGGMGLGTAAPVNHGDGGMGGLVRRMVLTRLPDGSFGVEHQFDGAAGQTPPAAGYQFKDFGALLAHLQQGPWMAGVPVAGMPAAASDQGVAASQAVEPAAVADTNPMGPATAALPTPQRYQPGAMGRVEQDIALPNEFDRSPANPAPEVVDRRALVANQAANTPPPLTPGQTPARAALRKAVEGYQALRGGR